MREIYSDATAVTAGSSYSMVLKLDGSVWATSRNDAGQLGAGSATSSPDGFGDIEQREGCCGRKRATLFVFEGNRRCVGNGRALLQWSTRGRDKN